MKNLSIIYNKIDLFCKDSEILNDKINIINLVVEELVTNIISYGYNDDLTHEIIVNLEIENDLLHIKIIDDGLEFNPIDSKDADVNSEIGIRQVGGLGIHLVKNLTESLSYVRENYKNIISTCIKIK